MTKYADKRGVLHRSMLSIAIAGCFCSGAAWGNPLGPQVVRGQVGVSQQGNLLSITNSPGSIINWQSFSIAPGETTRFLQQSASSSVLNRITGQDPSRILGALQSNGRVFLINPNGVLFGQGARVDVNGLVASSLQMTNEDFLAGRMRFQAGSTAEKVVNQGVITTPSGGQVMLIAPDIENSGIITSPKGEVLLAAGHSVRLVDTANPDLHVVISAPENEARNLGKILTEGGKTGIYGAFVKQRGIVSANSAVRDENGKIVFKASRDALLEAGSQTTAISSAGKGGEVQVLGERVALTGNAQIDASGAAGGGTVLVGGDYQGKNAAVPNAKQALLGKDATIRADATHNGDGGKVIVWSDDLTRAYGAISAKGGEQGGNGGLVETSGKLNLAFDARVDTSAKNGKAGTLLLDPYNMTIADGSSAADDGLLDISTTVTTSLAHLTISEQKLETFGGNIALQASGNITIDNLTDNELNLSSVTSGSTFSISAGGHITSTDVNDRVLTGGGNINFSTTNGKIDIGGVKSKGGTVTMTAGGTLGDMVIREIVTTPTVSGNGGAISLTSNGTSYMTLGGGHIDARGNGGTTGNVELDSGAPINMQSGKTIYANQLRMSAVGGITDSTNEAISTLVSSLDATSNSGGGHIMIDNSGESLTITDTSTAGYGVKQVNGGNIDISNTNNLTVNAELKNSGDMYLGAAGTLFANANIDAGPHIFINAAKMYLDTTKSIRSDMGSGRIEIDTSSAVDLGTTLNNVLGLSDAELDTLKAGTLYIHSSYNGNSINVTDVITPGNINTLHLDAVGTVTQQTGATMAIGGTVTGTVSMAIRGSSVNLPEANHTGIIAGSASSGDFVFRSYNQVSVNTVDGVSGISVPNANYIRLKSDTEGISQQSPLNAAGGGLVLEADGPAHLMNTSNAFGTLAADLNKAGSGDASSIYTTGALSIGSITGASAGSVGGITTNNADLELANNDYHALTVSQPINAGTGRVNFKIGDLSLGNYVTADSVSIRPSLAGTAITVGSATCKDVANCLKVYKLYKIQSPEIVIGTDTAGALAGPIHVDGIDPNSNTTDMHRYSGTTRIALLANGNITQTDLINVQDLGVRAFGSGTVTLNNTGNSVVNLAAKTDGGHFSFKNNGSLNIATMTNVDASSSYTVAGVDAGSGNVTLTSVSGALMGGVVKGASLTATANAGMTLATEVHTLTATNNGINTPIGISNTGELHLGHITQPNFSTSNSSTGNITIINIGAISVDGNVTADAGSIGIFAHSPLVVNGSVTTGSGNITLSAGSTGSANDYLSISGNVESYYGGNILLSAGSSISEVAGHVVAHSGTVTRLAGLNAPASATPTLSQCVENPTMSGCSSVLPTVDTCTRNPAQAGCTAVLPTVDTCTRNPTQAGCTAVLPTVDTCTRNPTQAGCTAVLPTVDACTRNPTQAGCSAVLPTVDACTRNPTQAGCSAVLPTVDICTRNPTQAGCSAVLPTLSDCVTTPSRAGCSAVLPTVSACAQTPTLTGCSAVLPTVDACTRNPTQTGCSVVLPTKPEETNDEVKQAINETIETINSTTEAVTEIAAVTTVQKSAESQTQSSSSSNDDGKKQEDQKETVATNDSGAKKNETAPKMYCN